MSESWNAWGDHRPPLPPEMQRLLTDELGPLTPQAAVPLPDARVPASALPAPVRERLAEVVGTEHLHDDDATRARHAGGQAYADLLARRHGDASAAPDAVVRPGSAAEVGAVLEACAAGDVAVVPWGGGTSVVGGLDALRGGHRAVIALDLGRMDALLAVDTTSLTATFQPGIRTPAAEAALATHGLTLGHLPQSYERATLGGYVVTRSAGQASGGYGRIDDLVAGLRMVTPVGELALPVEPASAAGPDLRRLVLGSEGTLGVVTEVTLRVRRRPAVRHYAGWMVPSWEAGQAALRRLGQDGPAPAVARLSDPDETRVSLGMSSAGAAGRALSSYLKLRRVGAGCLLILGFEGSAAEVRHRRRAARRAIGPAGAVALGRRAGQAWEHGRFSGPYLRDSLLDAGVLVETLETAATWSALPRLYDGVRGALRDSLGAALVGCHISHVYPTGASLYFTVLTAARPGEEAAQWAQAKQAANDAIVAAGGTITHHHAVGTVHRDHVVAELGDVGVAALRAVKERLDPAGVLNPGKLLPPATAAGQ